MELSFWLVVALVGGKLVPRRINVRGRPKMEYNEFAVWMSMTFPEGFDFPDPEIHIDVPVETQVLKPEVVIGHEEDD